MKNFRPLLDYIDAMDGTFGCKVNFEKSLYGDEKVNYASMSGYYSSLLDDAISLIPPAFIKNIREELCK